MSIMDKLKDPELLATLGVGDKLVGSLIVMVLGMVSCIVVLLLIMLVVNLLKIISVSRGKSEPPVAQRVPVVPEEDEAAVLAAITAAVAELEGSGRFYIRNVIAAPDREAWSQVRLEETADGQRTDR